MREVDEFYIFESPLSAPVTKLNLKHGDAFLVADRRGDIPRRLRGEFGFYLEGTRYVSSLELFLFHQRPVLLDASISEDGCQIVVELANAEVKLPDGVLLQRHNVLIRRRLVLYQNILFQSIWVRNFASGPVPVSLSLALGFDFADIFDVRAQRPHRRGRLSVETRGPSELRATYVGQDRLRRGCVVSLSQRPDELTPRRARYSVTLEPQAGWEIMVKAIPFAGEERMSGSAALSLQQAADRLRLEAEAWKAGCTAFSTDDEIFNKAIERAIFDLHMLKTHAPEGAFFSAGVPWFVAPFGRDGLITTMETMILKPRFAREILGFLKHHQGKKTDDFTEEEPGRILHEYRKGELANLRQIPFLPYYGSADATPLYLIALESYVRWSGDLEFLDAFWDSGLAALAWIDRYGDQDGDGYVEYSRRSSRGLSNQGWKDSHDAVFHEDGRLAEAPIALVEVQAYVYGAKKAMSRLAAIRGEDELSKRLENEAEALKARFNRDFWWPEAGYFYLALDREKRPCRVVTSNPAHGLWCGIMDPEKARAVAEKVMEEPLFSGWGVRTLSTESPRYNPLSYHNGSVWPHDNAIIACGLRNYGFLREMERIAYGVFDTTRFLEDQRLPELFGGFSRASRIGPTPYPVACRPQAWAAGALFMILQALLGIEVDALNQRLTLRRPLVPAWLGCIEIRNLELGASRVDFLVQSGRFSGSVEILEKSGDLEVMIIR